MIRHRSIGLWLTAVPALGSTAKSDDGRHFHAILVIKEQLAQAERRVAEAATISNGSGVLSPGSNMMDMIRRRRAIFSPRIKIRRRSSLPTATGCNVN